MRPTVGAVDTAHVTLQYGGGTLRLAEDGSLTIDVPQATINAPETMINGNVAIDGTLSVSEGMTGAGNGLAITGGDVTHDGVSIGKTHRHGGVQSGGDNTGTPV